jgi:hypothetical protein
MSKNHGARQQKRAAKQKAKRSAKRAMLLRRDSKDPTVRLERAGEWPVVSGLVGDELWDTGIGYLSIAREQSDGQLIIATFLVDVYCLGVKNAFWLAGTRQDLQNLIQKMETIQSMRAVSPACLVAIVKGAVEYAQSFGFAPHPDYRHAAMVLDGIDPSFCSEQFTFGCGGKPVYVQGPNESPAMAMAITERVRQAGADFMIGWPGASVREPAAIEDDFDRLDSLEADHFSDESP